MFFNRPWIGSSVHSESCPVELKIFVRILRTGVSTTTCTASSQHQHQRPAPPAPAPAPGAHQQPVSTAPACTASSQHQHRCPAPAPATCLESARGQFIVSSSKNPIASLCGEKGLATIAFLALSALLFMIRVCVSCLAVLWARLLHLVQALSRLLPRSGLALSAFFSLARV